MVFISDYDTIARKLHETEEFVHILQEEDEFPANYFFDYSIFFVAFVAANLVRRYIKLCKQLLYYARA